MAFLKVTGPVMGNDAIVDVEQIVAVMSSYQEGEDGKPEVAGTHMILRSGDAVACADKAERVMAAVERLTGKAIIPVEVN